MTRTALHGYLVATETSQAQFAKRAGISPTAISNFARGAFWPSRNFAVAIEVATDGAVPVSVWPAPKPAKPPAPPKEIIRRIREVRVTGSVAHIELTRGFEAIIDASDVGLIAHSNWCATPRQLSDGSLATVHVQGSDIRGRRIALHRLIADAQSRQCVDHINGDGLDNRRANLRLCNQSLNGANRRIGVNNTSGFKGVTWNIGIKRWFVTICVAGKARYVGVYYDRLDAARAYDSAVVEAFGEFALTNEALGLLSKGGV